MKSISDAIISNTISDKNDEVFYTASGVSSIINNIAILANELGKARSECRPYLSDGDITDQTKNLMNNFFKLSKERLSSAEKRTGLLFFEKYARFRSRNGCIQDNRGNQ